MAAAADGGKNSVRGGGAEGGLQIVNTGAARDQARPAGEHAIPHSARVFVVAAAGYQQSAFEVAAEGRINLSGSVHESRPPLCAPARPGLKIGKGDNDQ